MDQNSPGVARQKTQVASTADLELCHASDHKPKKRRRPKPTPLVRIVRESYREQLEGAVKGGAAGLHSVFQFGQWWLTMAAAGKGQICRLKRSGP